MSRRCRSKLADSVRSLCVDRRRPVDVLALSLLAATTVYGNVAVAQQGSTEEITVTGSRLRRDGMSSPTPVTAVAMDEMRAMAPTLLMDSLNQLPQFRENDQSQTGSIFTTSGGANAVNLRGIGSKRTLTLLNGRRVVSGQQAGTVDIAILPTALIERVEVVTGGASAAYGSDAISGVTNFILDTDFEGVKGDIQTGMTSRHDHNNYQAQFAGGTAIGERGHFVGSVDYFKADAVLGLHDRDWGHEGWALFTEPSLTAVPRRFYAPQGRSRAISAGGIIPSGPLGVTQFIDGVPSPLGAGSRVVGSTQVGGGGRDLAVDWFALRPEDSRSSAFGMYTFDFSDTKKAYVQVLKGNHENVTPPTPTGFAPGWGLTIFNDNPFLPESLRTRMATANVTSFPFNRVFEQFASDRAVEDKTTSVTLGFDGEVGNDLFLSAYYQYGENIEIGDYSPNGLLPRTDRIYRALDSVLDPATGRVACRANLPQFGGLTPEQEAQITRLSVNEQPISPDPESNRKCVPMNPFAAELPQAVVDYVTGGGIYHHQKLRQDVVDVTLQTNLGEQRKSGAISLGGGLSWRDEWMYQDAYGTAEDPRRIQGFGVFSSFLDPNDRVPIRGVPAFVRDRGVFTTGNPNGRGPLVGDFNVWELFVESIIPVLKTDDGGLDLHAAARYADYSGSGGVWAGKLGADWTLNEQVRFRATLSRDTRAGTLSERFDTQGSGFNLQQGQDPLNPALAYIPGLTTGGNPNIRPELSDTWTVGMVFQPDVANDLNLSVDLYEIKIKDAIDQLGALEIIDRCYIQGATELCSLIERNEQGLIRSIFNVYINISETVTKGVDLEMSYRRPIEIFGGDEAIAVRFFANYLEEISSAFVGAQFLNEAGQLEYPKWLTTASFTYSNGPFRLNWQTRYRDKTTRDYLWLEGRDIENNRVSSRSYTNLNLAYDMDFGDTTGELYFYIGNLFDKDPPMVASGIGGTSGTSSYTNNGIFDTLGRTYSVGVKFQF